jgi:hypothetical protein
VIEDILFPYEQKMSQAKTRLRILRDTARAEGRASAQAADLVDDEATTDLIARVVEDYLDQLNDPGEVEAQELAENIARNLQRGTSGREG